MTRRPDPIDETTYEGRVAARVRARREKLGMSVGEAAEAAGMAAKTWYDLESGRRGILRHVEAIAAALGCGIGDLIPKQ